jgi:hypothetical protein
VSRFNGNCQIPAKPGHLSLTCSFTDQC